MVGDVLTTASGACGGDFPVRGGRSRCGTYGVKRSPEGIHQGEDAPVLGIGVPSTFNHVHEAPGHPGRIGRLLLGPAARGPGRAHHGAKIYRRHYGLHGSPIARCKATVTSRFVMIRLHARCIGSLTP